MKPRAGAGGIILSRKYSEMQLANLSAAGRAVRDCGERLLEGRAQGVPDQPERRVGSWG